MHTSRFNYYFFLINTLIFNNILNLIIYNTQSLKYLTQLPVNI